ncbi:short-chain dehydrogenase/reductase [Pedobacter sp. KBW06]|uniref:SDR family NAD(P)-dependent oxidoreductase n=1 Tax=Pedobacter sp. KBW06 TaxID=2153359 RepID=UPI000F596630|nr:SDR family NAD(P)-dependent oxidoreductase [Pedobacter sp. KBW06]RQO66299.1 short-chain dehydrogenase/reductase [Pedobacter sp. KBW06]
MKTILITGASSGLGKAAAKLFQARGWQVIATMRNPEKETELTGLENISLLEMDLTRPDQVQNAIEMAIRATDIDVVLNNAGYGLTGPFEAYAAGQIEKQIDTNLTGVLRVAHPFVKYFRENQRKGLFITVTSAVAIAASPFASVYTATKYALEGWSESMNYDLNAFGIQFKTVAPGGIKTNFGSGALVLVQHPAYEPLWNKMMAGFQDGSLIHFSEPEEIAAVIYQAATDGKDQQKYAAGKDALALSAKRAELGFEAHRKEITSYYQV